MENEDLAKLLNDMIRQLEGQSEGNPGIQNLVKEIEKMKTSVVDLEREVRTDREKFIVLQEKFYGLIEQYKNVREDIEELKDMDEKDSDRRYQAVEKVGMLIIGAVVSQIITWFQR